VEPGSRLRLAGEAPMVNAGSAVTVSCSLVALTRVPEVPVMAIVEDVGAAELFAVSVSVLLVVAVAGLNNAVTPAGRPEAARFTAPLKPF
jgi:hypothetical protein